MDDVWSHWQAMQVLQGVAWSPGTVNMRLPLELGFSTGQGSAARAVSLRVSGTCHGWRVLAGCSPWGRKESDTTERQHYWLLQEENWIVCHCPGMGVSTVMLTGKFR